MRYSDLGKKAKDLFKKQYDFKNEVKVTSKTNGVKIESGGNSALAGYTKANWKDDFLGDIEIEAHSTGVARGKFALKNVADGVNLTVDGAACGGIGAEATYSSSSFAATAKASHNVQKSITGLTASATVGYDAFVLGGNVALDGAGAAKDYAVGAQYSSGDILASFTTGKKFANVDVNVFQKYSCCTALGASIALSDNFGAYTFGFGADHSLGQGLGVKAKADSNGGVAVAVTHTLAEPKMKVGISASYNALGTDAFKAQKFGLSLNFGDF